MSVTTTQLTQPSGQEAFLSELITPLHDLPQIARTFSTTFHNLALNSSAQFLPTPITNLPDGKEKGKFLALDLGGSNLRVGVVELFGEGNASTSGWRGAEKDPASPDSSESVSQSASSIHSLPLVTPEPQSDPVESGILSTTRFKITPSSTWTIPDDLKSQEAEALFDWVGECIALVIRTYRSQCPESEAEEITHEGLPLGVTFSFPMVQSSHSSALLMSMGKGFIFSTTNDLATLITNAYAKQRNLGGRAGEAPLPKIEVVAITNDSISTLLAGGYVHNGNSTVGIIAGTGTNATCLCPVEKLGEFKKPAQTPGATHVLLNTEWSINGTLPPIEKYMTKWDQLLDQQNEKPGFQPLEEMVGGRYLGELVRLVSVDVLGKGEKCSNILPEKLYKPYAIETKLCADVEGTSETEELIRVLNAYFLEPKSKTTWEWTPNSANIFKAICQAISDRAAALVVAATVGILDVNDDLGLNNPIKPACREDVVISFTGTILEKYPRFRERCQIYMDQVTEKWYNDSENGHENSQTESKPFQKKRVRLVEARDGGIIGAAVLAGMVRAGRT